MTVEGGRGKRALALIYRPLISFLSFSAPNYAEKGGEVKEGVKVRTTDRVSECARNH